MPRAISFAPGTPYPGCLSRSPFPALLFCPCPHFFFPVRDQPWMNAPECLYFMPALLICPPLPASSSRIPQFSVVATADSGLGSSTGRQGAGQAGRPPPGPSLLSMAHEDTAGSIWVAQVVHHLHVKGWVAGMPPVSPRPSQQRRWRQVLAQVMPHSLHHAAQPTRPLDLLGQRSPHKPAHLPGILIPWLHPLHPSRWADAEQWSALLDSSSRPSVLCAAPHLPYPPRWRRLL